MGRKNQKKKKVRTKMGNEKEGEPKGGRQEVQGRIREADEEN